MSYEKKDTLCWSCYNACDNGCSWSRKLKPVPGWMAEPTYVNGAGDSYLVIDCPEHYPYRGFESANAITTSGMLALLEQAMRIARRDYILSGDFGRQEIEDFLMDWLPHGEGAIYELRRAARKRDKEQEEKIHNAD